MKRFAAVIAGGAGERFWPISRIARPKHLCDITDAGASLLEQTFRRLENVVPAENIFVVTNREQIGEIRRVCPFIPAEKIIAEPARRDTLAAVGLSTLVAEFAVQKIDGNGSADGNDDALVAVLPADQVIRDVAGFRKTAEKAFETAARGNFLVTVGIAPTRPATGFGYIRAGKEFVAENAGADEPKVFDAERFHEKPDAATAREYVAHGAFFWNTGMFFGKASSLRGAIARFAPGCAAVFEKIRAAVAAGTPPADALAENYPQLEKKSFDFAVMEKADNVKVVPAAFDWDDVGTWTALERHFAADADGNVFRGSVFAENSQKNLVFDATRSRATVLLGAENLIVVHTADATLICDREHAEMLKALVRKLPDALR